MSMSVGPAEGGEDAVLSSINTTPLVDVMLVLLIIFLITIPVVVTVVPVELPHVTNVATITKPENIVIAVDKNGKIYWNNAPVGDSTVLFQKMAEVAVRVPQPEVHIRGDRDARYQYVGQVFAVCQRAGILKVGFITDPERGG